MTICIDIGNSATKIANIVKNGIDNISVFAEIYKALEFIVSNRSTISNIFISSVVPVNSAKFKVLAEKNGIAIFEITREAPFSFGISYNSPQSLGIDRLCGMQGAVSELEDRRLDYSGIPVLTIDFGTATTVNVLSPSNEFVGGVIAPGIQTMINSLNLNTSQLPEISRNQLTDEIGNDTISCISSGITNSQLGLISQIIMKTSKKFNTEPKVFVTGGNYRFIEKFMNFEHLYEEFLVIKGMNYLSKKIS